MEPIYIQVLEYLSGFGIEKSVSANNFLRELFDRPKDMIDINFDLIGEEISVFIQKMQDNKHVKIYKLQNTFEISLSFCGFEFLERHRLTTSNIRVNDASLRNYNIQKIGIAITAFFAFVGAVFSIATFFKPEPKMVELNKNIQSLSKELTGIKQQIKSMPYQKVNLLDSPRIH